MKSLLLASALVLAAGAAQAQNWSGTAVPFGGSIYGGQPSGYSFQFQNHNADLQDIGRQQLHRFAQPQSRYEAPDLDRIAPLPPPMQIPYSPNLGITNPFPTVPLMYR